MLILGYHNKICSSICSLRYRYYYYTYHRSFIYIFRASFAWLNKTEISGATVYEGLRSAVLILALEASRMSHLSSQSHAKPPVYNYQAWLVLIFSTHWKDERLTARSSRQTNLARSGIRTPDFWPSIERCAISVGRRGFCFYFLFL